ncbi:MAG: SDR family oxidoreductase [Microterricola sp.]
MDTAAAHPRGVVLTGGASGIGAATSVAFAQAGYDVVFGYHAKDPHDPWIVTRQIEAHGRRAHAVELDVRSTESVDHLFAVASERLASIDAVVANAGILQRHSIEQMRDEDWYDVIDVDLTGIMRVFRAASPRMGSGAALVAVASITGAIYGWAEHAHYAAAKAGIRGLVRSLAMEFGSRGIRVNTVIPGLVRTPQSLDEVQSLGEKALQALAPSVPIGRIGTPEDIAGVIRFLCSDDAQYVTAAELVVDGGLTVRQSE